MATIQNPDLRRAIADRIRNPLAVISGNAEMLLLFPDEEQAPRRARDLMKAVRELVRALKETLDL